MTAYDVLYGDLNCLQSWLRTVESVDLRCPDGAFAPESPEWREVIDDALSRIRQRNSTAPRDRYERILVPLPDAVNAAYANLFRIRNRSFNQMVGDLRPSQVTTLPVESRPEHARRTAAGGTQRSAFPDGTGSVLVDDYGFPGDWEYSIGDGAETTTALALRTIDALSKAGARGGRVRFVTTSRGDPWWDAVGDEVLVPESFARLSRRDQIDRLVMSREWLGIRPAIGRPVSPVPPAQQTSRVLLGTLALVHTGKARDYTHYRFNYRVSVMAQTLNDCGIEARSRSIEDLPSYTAFVAAYRHDPVDVVVLSVYQHKPHDMTLLANLLRDLRAIRPDVFTVLEGVATQPAKQMLAFFPNVDMLVRGESDSVVRALLAVKERGQPLTDDQREFILRDGAARRHGVFLRTRTGGVFSSLDCEQQDHEPQLLRPDRHMQSVWYSERGCPSSCGYCPLYTGHQSGARVVSAERRIQWMLDRLKLEFAAPAAADDEALRQWLKVPSADPPFAVRDDTFMGRGKVTITIVSQNALVNRPVWLAFAREVRDHGLDRFFRLKVADTSIMTLWRHSAADRELIRALKDAGVFFIGFGTESLSERILSDLRKGHGHHEASDYHADAPIEIAAALHEERFPVDGVRHNFMSNAPESRLEDVKEGMVLAYAGPLFNHAIDRLGNGWGNSRQNRLYAMEGSLHTAIDSLRYGDSYRDRAPDGGTDSNGISLFDEFFVCHEAPEYKIRREDGRLTYIDERLQPLTTAFTHPVFYRYAMKDVLRAHVSHDDIREMRTHWENGSSRELRAFARILGRYHECDSRWSHLETLFHVKAHMLSFECFRFTEWEQRLGRFPDLPRELESAGVGSLVAEADESMRPAAFDPSVALARQMLSAQRARLTWMACEQAHPSPGRRAIDLSGGTALEDLRAREGERRTRGLHTMLSYPDAQQFDDLCKACPSIPAASLFDQLSEEMRNSGVAVAAAVRNIVRRVLGLNDTGYDDFVKRLKKYEALSSPLS